MKISNADIKTIFKFGLPLILTVILILIVSKFGLAKISDLRFRISQSQTNLTDLTRKLSFLNKIDPNVISQSSASVVALPDENPALIAVSQLKSLASEKGMTLSSLKTGSEVMDESGLKKVEISFDVESSRPLILEYLNGVERLSPILLIEKAKINESGGIARGSVTLKAFWSELPDKLPPLSQGSEDLSPEEISILGVVSSLTQPQFSEVSAQDNLSERSDPFNF